MGVSTDYPNVPEWVSKSTGYQAGSMVKYKGNIFYAAFWGLEPGVGDADHNGWRFYDELYDLTPHTPTQEAKIIAYIPTWRKKEGFNYANAEMYRHITHGIVAFLMFSETNLGEFDPTSVNDVNAVLPDVVNTGHEKDTRISIALGGATDYGFFNLMTSVGNNPANPLLDKAVQNVVNFVKSNDLDGVDLDLECWWDKNSDPSKDQGGRLKSEGPHPAGYALTLFAQKLKQAMPDKLVSVTLFGTSWYGNNYDSKIADYVDWLAIMTYDLTGSWNASPVGPHSALFKIRNQDSAKIREQEFYQESYTKEQQGEWPGGGILNNPILSVEDTLWYWTNPLFVNSQGAGQNIPRNKIATGVPTYGYDFAYQKDPDDLSGQIPPGYKLIQYKNILAQFPDASTAANGNIKVPGNTPRPPFVSAAGTYPYAHDIYFETPQTATDKLNFLKSIGAQGVIIWELSNDVWEEGKSSILKVLYKNSGNPDKSPAIQDGGSSVGDGDFGKPVRYDTGDWSDVALNSENVVVGLRNSIVNDNPGFANLSYDIGRVDGDKIQWTSNFPSLEKGERWPSIAINNSGLVVEVYESSGGHTLWCKVGNVVADNNINGGKRIDWGESWQYDGEGTWPSVAINDHGLVVGVHTTDQANLWYRVGTYNSSSSPAIDWRKSIWYGGGEHPSVAINNNGLVVEVHQSEALGVSYRVGRVADDGIRINWGDEIKYDNGIKPSVAINNDGLVVEVHQSESGDTLWYRGTGQVNDTNKTITWSNAESQDYSNGQSPRVACNGEFAVETNCGIPIDGKTNEVFYSVLTLPAYRSNWIQLQGENSYFYCACNRPANNKERQASDHTMTIQEGAPYLYAVLTKDDDTVDFPTGAVLTIEGPDGTQYNRDIEEENQLVIMSDSSVRCLIIKDPKPGDWKMTMTVPEGVGFHCECNTVPSKDVYDTMTKTLDNSLQKRGLGIGKSAGLWSGLVLLGAILFPEVELPVIAVRAFWMAASVGFVSYVVPGKSGDTQTVELSRDEQKQVGKAMGDSLKVKVDNKGGVGAAQWLKGTASGKSKTKKKKKVKQYVYAVAHNGRGDFIIGFKNQFGWFFHNNGGEVKPRGQSLNGGNDYALPGGELEILESPIIGAWREFFEETNEHLGGWRAQPDVYEGREPPDEPEPRVKYYGVYFDFGVDRLLPLFETIAAINLESGRSAAQAVIRGEFQGDYNGLRAAFPGCPPDNELREVHMWSLRSDWQTIQGWQVDQNKSWYYYILNNLRNQLGITG